MKKSEVEFVEALREVGLSKSICESVNNIRKVIFEESSPEESLSFEEKVEKYNETHDIGVFDYVERFNDFDGDYVIVTLGNKDNIVDEKEGKLLFSEWFDDIDDHAFGDYIIVERDGKESLLDRKGNLLFNNNWFDEVVILGRIYKSKEYGWYDIDDDEHVFEYGYALVKMNGKWNFVDREGNLLSDQWFDKVELGNDNECFHKGYADVELDGKRYKIDTEGNLHEY